MKITDSIIKLEATNHSHSYAIIQNNEITLIDSCVPGHGEAIIAELAEYGFKPNDVKLLLLTHHDVDHIGSANVLQALTGCEVYVNELDLPYIIGDKEREGIKAGRAKELGIVAPSNIKPFSDNQINGIRIIPTSGHTPGHCCFVYNKVIFVGDLVQVKDEVIIPMNDMYVLDKPQSFASCEKLELNDIDWLCPAHGEPIKIVPAWQNFLNEFIK